MMDILNRELQKEIDRRNDLQEKNRRLSEWDALLDMVHLLLHEMALGADAGGLSPEQCRDLVVGVLACCYQWDEEHNHTFQDDQRRDLRIRSGLIYWLLQSCNQGTNNPKMWNAWVKYLNEAQQVTAISS